MADARARRHLGHRRRTSWAQAASESSQQALPPIAQAIEVAVDRPTDQPGHPITPIPGHDEVVQPEPQLRQRLVCGRQARQTLEPTAEVVREVAGQPAGPGRRLAAQATGRFTAQPARRQAPEQPSGAPERIGAVVGLAEGEQGVGREIAPSRTPSWAGALEEDEAGQAAQTLGSIERRELVEERDALEHEAACQPGSDVEGHRGMMRHHAQVSQPTIDPPGRATSDRPRNGRDADRS